METSDSRKRREELRQGQAAVQEAFNRSHAPFAEREDEPETNDNPMEGLPWREDFPEPAWHKDTKGDAGTAYDPVAQPEHYTHSRIEVWDAIDAWGLGYRLGNVVKYVSRADRKGAALQDLMKARAYLDKDIATRQQDARDW